MTNTEPTVVLLGSDLDVGTVLVYQCQKTWDDLQATGHDDVRYCDRCKQAVCHVIDVKELSECRCPKALRDGRRSKCKRG